MNDNNNNNNNPICKAPECQKTSVALTVLLSLSRCTVVNPLIVCDDCAAGVSPSHRQEASQPSQRRTRSSHSTDAFESLPVKKGDVCRCATVIAIIIMEVVFSSPSLNVIIIIIVKSL